MEAAICGEAIKIRILLSEFGTLTAMEKKEISWTYQSRRSLDY